MPALRLLLLLGFFSHCPPSLGRHETGTPAGRHAEDPHYLENQKLRGFFRSAGTAFTENLEALAYPGSVQIDDSLAYNIWRDFQFARGAAKATKDLDLSNTFIVVELGAAHTLAVAMVLREKGVDANLLFPKPVHSRFSLLGYLLARNHKRNSSKFSGKQNSHAIMVDSHRYGKYDLERDVIPSADELKKLGIKKVLFLSEMPTGSKPFPKTAWNYMKRQSDGLDLRTVEWNAAGIPIERHGIDEVAKYNERMGMLQDKTLFRVRFKEKVKNLINSGQLLKLASDDFEVF